MIEIVLKKYLKENKISLYRISEETGVTYSALHNLINNKTKGVDFSTLQKVMNYLDLKDFNEMFSVAE